MGWGGVMNRGRMSQTALPVTMTDGSSILVSSM